MIRKFRLINREGVSWDLNARASFLHSIGGFGYKDGTQYEQIGTDFIPLEELFSQGVMTGRIFFGGKNAYQNYRAFSRFVRAVPVNSPFPRPGADDGDRKERTDNGRRRTRL